MAQLEPTTPDTKAAVTPAVLRAPNLSLQALGYSRAETTLLLERAAEALEENASSAQTRISDLETALREAQLRLAEDASREPASVEKAVGEVLVTAHRAAELVRQEADREVDALVGGAREQARKILEEADRKAAEVAEARARAEEALAESEEEARAAREDAEREIAVLHAEASRVRLVIDEFRNQWWELISDALRKLELQVPSGDAQVDETDNLHDDLRSRLADTEAEREARGDAPRVTGPDNTPTRKA